MATLEEFRNIRIDKLNQLEKLGINPYPPKAERTHTNKEILKNFPELEGKVVTVVGRIMGIREHGALIFMDLKDENQNIQLYIKQEDLQEDLKNQKLGFKHLNLFDRGDFAQAAGKLTKTKRGEISIQVENIKLLSKSLRPLPDKWEGFKDVEERYRKRYIDFLINEEAKKIIDIRWKATQEVRKFLWSKGFKEVETPVLQSIYGGTNARPFTTYFNALDRDYYLRIAPELYLKRLIVGGYEKVFEIARNFRNEGIDHSHFPEFTMLEWYEAYADYQRVMNLAEEMIKYLVKEIKGNTIIQVNEKEIDIGIKWKRKTLKETLKEHLDIDWDDISEKEVKNILAKDSIEVKGTWNKEKALFQIFENKITSKLEGPVWIIDYPLSVSPLSKKHRSMEKFAERFEGYIGGVEIFDGWSEIISGLEQRRRFENEQKEMKEGYTEAMPLDEEFIEALEYGCPPLGGIGFGIERLIMFLTNTWAIKDVMPFPILKPRTE